ncbi:MAG: hypothetical protein A3A87_09760 [Candidatus Muproteobacteria bacterium RIFCSPLOWO2_01_FULL_60_18]|uniref:Probable membrane transporter protein n=1 Tax=Candidatus Muproteobacteria bacterium RIFCSPLOWO2_01_FULL_60_18 TaxID=1817768 RepID=A0A1F6TYN4_9PROT|nr:MAG: hypothetical protein A2W42_04960 [Candidatus Muproteobacteria bacterium RIFCSPHIGHO2_01_60_12]OGI50245.1 MAG: hypothetical protein A3A87_09760 [Candidatus Muproteobacteria bacterium RIFCSPLOWO2_01_FULL_60_18]
MDAGLFPTLFSLGLLGGFLSGLLGIGGGIIMVPLLLYVPSALGVGALTMKTVAGITSVQSFFGALSGAIGHKRYNRISVPLAYAVGGSTTVGSLAGSIASAHLSSETLLMVFAAMAIVAAVMMVLPKHEVGPEPEVASLQFNKPLAIAVGLVIGTLSGIIGQGGAFLFVPAMLYILRIPTRITIGTTLAVGIASSAAVLVGRLGTSQIPYLMSAVLVAGVLIGAQLGSVMSQKTPRRLLRGVLSALIAATALKIWHELLLA